MGDMQNCTISNLLFSLVHYTKSSGYSKIYYEFNRIEFRFPVSLFLKTEGVKKSLQLILNDILIYFE